MAIKDILIHIDARPATSARLALAVALARRHGARLTGLYVKVPDEFGVRLASSAEAADAAATLFAEATRCLEPPATWQWLNATGPGLKGIAHRLIHQAFASDLVVVGQTVSKTRGAGLPEQLILASGRPVLVVPSAGTFAGVGERVLVAWSSGPGACRALHWALPLLRKAAKVTLLEVTGQRGAKAEDAEICNHLARHETIARLERQALLGGRVGDLLLNRVCDESFDLLVMGAGKVTAGGTPNVGAVTSQILQQMTVPVLLAS